MLKRMNWLCCGLSFLTLVLTWVPAMASSPNVQIVGYPQSFGLLQLAYDAATTGVVIQAQEITFVEDLTLDNTSTDVTLEGGFDPTFSTQNGYTMLQGTLTVAQGSLVVDHLTITDSSGTTTTPTLVSIAVTPASPGPSIAVGATQQFTAAGMYSDNSAHNLTASVTWSSSSTSVATIAASGIATAMAAGTTTIMATSRAIAGTTTLTVAQNQPVNGACGSSSGQSFTSLTSESSNLCSTGTVASFTGSGPWTWGCNGSGGGTSTSSTACTASLTSSPPATLLFSESFENNSYASRGWYDNTNHGTIVSGGQSGNCLQWAWASGATTPTNGGSMRMEFTPTDSLYLSYYVKFQSGWRGSGQAYHPHLMCILSDIDDAANAYSPLANNYLDTYLEFLADVASPYTIRPQIALQDELRVNTSNGTPPNNLTSITENRSVNYCNTPVSTGATGTCFADFTYYSANTWKASTASVSTNAWHHVEVYLKMNTISGGKGQSNGIMQEWIDGTQVINHSDVLYRTNQDATKKWAQFVLAPYMAPTSGGGSPMAQTMWIDELTVGTSPP